ncbi:histidine kinase N-terminal 7TM domain-containing diguanylate cyclase [Pseudobacillus wudalianchiensis]|uniref:Diguanylate cyclase n=1 Tax=Pseudobacillus wudalianchiensis TaxID=1743143 RepID=A0A1B9AGB6_9BACI|nr:histidine kinase N-terminal 7TM domain-containing protein [Bacillus wudalianchiensis]OCA82883.1 hypothetical protein A8F95_14245 [Bacillus wudalianchiensis]
MNLEIFRYVVIVSVSGVLSILLAIYAYTKRDVSSSSTIFIFMSCLSAIYIFGHAFELASRNLTEITLWLKVQYVGLPFIAPTCLVLILKYAGLEVFVKRKTLLLLFLIPTLTSLVSFTNDFHHLLYRSIYLRPEEGAMLADIVVGPWYIIHGSYTFGCLLLGACILLWYWKRTKDVYWKQIIPLLLGLILPMMASFLYLIGLSPHGMDPVPVVMCLTSALYLWAIFSSKLLILAPIARDRVFESMRDGVVVINSAHQIIDYNQAAESILSQLNSSSIGKNIEAILGEENQAIPYQYDNQKEEQEFEWINKETHKCYHVRVTPMFNDKKIMIGHIIVLSDITAQKTLEDQLKKLAYTDGLTQIYNRSYFIVKSQECMKQAIEKEKPLSILLFDIDYFKKINDRYGHSIGDSAICHVVSICKKHLQPTDVFGRYGGEEFVICLPYTAIHEAGRRAEKIRAHLTASPLQTDKGPLAITASFGVTEMRTAADTMDELLQEADQALYSSKESGRNAVHLAIGNSFVQWKENE